MNNNEITQKAIEYQDQEDYLFKSKPDIAHDAFIEGAKFALELAAERATVFLPSHPHLHGTHNVDKQSILKLIP